MTDQSRSTLNLPIVNSVVNANDRILILYSQNTVNAQTASISINSFLNMVGNLIPNTNPHVNGAIWVDLSSNNVLKISLG